MKWTVMVVMVVVGCGPTLDPRFLGSWNTKIVVMLPQHDSLIYQSVLTISSVSDTGSYVGTGMCLSQNDQFALEGQNKVARAVVTWNGIMTCFPIDLIWCRKVTLDYQSLDFVYRESTNKIVGTGTGRALDLDCKYSEPITVTYQAIAVQ